MCELLGVSAKRPLPGREIPLAQFRRHGGAAADNPDGWGIAWRSPGFVADWQLEKEPYPAWNSPRFADMIETVRSDLLIAHVRKARHPPVNTVGNTHPFLHECCGKRWVFAHNGLVPHIVTLESSNRERVCSPAGETDSEFAFCHLLSHVTQHLSAVDTDVGRLTLLGKVGERIARHGMFNFLLSDGDYLAAYGHDHLHYRESVHEGIALIATAPLTNDAGWTAFEPGELRIYRAGACVGRVTTHPPAPHSDLGLTLT